MWMSIRPVGGQFTGRIKRTSEQPPRVLVQSFSEEVGDADIAASRFPPRPPVSLSDWLFLRPGTAVWAKRASPPRLA
jgi:hypothetical protein